jgi:hypothetical protein
LVSPWLAHQVIVGHRHLRLVEPLSFSVRLRDCGVSVTSFVSWFVNRRLTCRLAPEIKALEPVDEPGPQKRDGIWKD